MCVSAESANAPLTLLTMNQPMLAVNAFRPDGRNVPRNPNAPRACTICGTPNFGPQLDSTPWDSAPSAEPSSTPSAVSQNPPPNTAIGSTPTYTVANSRFGDIHVQNRSSGRPWRSRSGIISMPPGSTANTSSPYSPSRTGMSGVSAGPSVVAVMLRIFTLSPDSPKELSPENLPAKCDLGRRSADRRPQAHGWSVESVN